MLSKESAGALFSTLAKARIAGDVDAIMALYTDDVSFHVNGLGERIQGKPAVRDMLKGLIDNFQFLEWRPLNILCTGNDMVVRAVIKVRYKTSQTIHDSETSEHFTLRDGKIASYDQYVNSLLAHRMVTEGI